jgi:hypothetical protein
MTCLEARAQLPEHVLGLLPPGQAADVERHLRRCAGCRRETAELQEGLAVVSLSLPLASAAPALEDRVVERVMSSARSTRVWRHPRGSRRAVRVLAAASLAAVLVAVGAVGWAVAERQRAQDTRLIAAQRLRDIKGLDQIIASFGGQPFQALLLPVAGTESSGTAVIVSAKGADSFVLVDVLPIVPNASPYSVQLIDRSGSVMTLGRLEQSTSGDLVLLQFPTQDLSKVLSVTVLDSHSNVVLTGKVAPYSKG